MDDQPERSTTQSPINNFTARLGRQLSRGLLPALRNLVRTRRGSRTRETEADVDARSSHRDVAMTEASSAPPTSPSAERSIDAVESSEPDNIMDRIDTEDQTASLIQPPLANPPSSSTSDNMDITERINNAINTNLNSLLNNAFPGLPSFPPMPRMSNLLGNQAANTEDGPAPTSPPSNPDARQRYRLVVYFEERSQEEQPTARYVAVIVGRLDELQSLLASTQNGGTGTGGLPNFLGNLNNGVAGLNDERNFTDLLNHLFQAYAPKGTPPAKQEAIDLLPTITIDESNAQSCMVCLEEFEIGTKAVVLPCNHVFHGDECVKTWLKMHNSCPMCRYELPVEDAEYEEKRKERMIARGFSHEDHHHGHSHDSNAAEDDVSARPLPAGGDANM